MILILFGSQFDGVWESVPFYVCAVGSVSGQYVSTR